MTDGLSGIHGRSKSARLGRNWRRGIRDPQTILLYRHGITCRPCPEHGCLNGYKERHIYCWCVIERTISKGGKKIEECSRRGRRALVTCDSNIHGLMAICVSELVQGLAMFIIGE